MDFIFGLPSRSRREEIHSYPMELLERPTTRLDYVPEHQQILESPRNSYHHQHYHHHNSYQQQHRKQQLQEQQQQELRVSSLLMIQNYQ